jgi:hypothetical protein
MGMLIMTLEVDGVADVKEDQGEKEEYTDTVGDYLHALPDGHTPTKSTALGISHNGFMVGRGIKRQGGAQDNQFDGDGDGPANELSGSRGWGGIE